MAERWAGGTSDYLASERTFLARIRTGLALMGFGFVVDRFARFLQAPVAAPPIGLVMAYGPSFWFGAARIALGVIVTVACVWAHFRLVHEQNRGGSAFNRPSWLAKGVAVILAVVGLAITIDLSPAREGKAFSGGEEKSMTSIAENGIVTIPSHHSVEKTVEKLKELLQAKNVKLFALVDHSGEAEKAGMQMPQTKLLIFGSPKAGTPVMLAAPSSAIDLPLKVLVWEDPERKVWISYNSAKYLKERHKIPEGLLQPLEAAAALAEKAAE